MEYTPADKLSLSKILRPALLKFLKDTKLDLERKGFIPTLDIAIEQFEMETEEDDGENAKPLTKREQKNAEEIQESDDFDQNNVHQS